MSNRVLKDKIWTSPTLSKLSLTAELNWPRWLLMTDDWGCFNADPRVIKGLIFPLREEVKTADINKLLKEYVSIGLIFVWTESSRQWGFFTGWDTDGSFCNKTNVDDDGKQLKHRRRTPVPPNQLLKDFQDKLGQVRATSDIFLDPDPDPDPKERLLRSLSTPQFNVWFNQIIGAYPNKLYKASARGQLKLLKPTEQLITEILFGIERWKASEQWQENNGQFVPTLTKFLSNHLWKEDVPLHARNWKDRAKTLIQEEEYDY